MKTVCLSSLFAALLLPVCVCSAAGLQISPTGLSVPAKQRAAVFTLTNTGAEPLTAQVRVFRWTQDESGKDVLTPTRDMVASPPMVRLASGAVQQFRVVRAKAAAPAEEAYRLLVDELPAPGQAAKGGLQFVLRYSVPVFLNQTENPETELQWQARPAGGGKMQLAVRNTGIAHAQLSNMVWQSAEGRHVLLNGLVGYVLPGKNAHYTVDAPPAMMKNGRLSLMVNGRPTQAEVRFAAH